TGFTAMGGYTYFSAIDGAHGTELWRTDGTALGTTLVADINATTSSSPSSLTAAPAGILYFAAYEPVHGTELWKTDGTATGTSLVKDLAASGTSSYLADISSVDGGSTVYFEEV